jgi:hypothetical protein
VNGKRLKMSSMRTYHSRVALGLCVECGKKPPHEGRTMCGMCLHKRVKYNKTYEQTHVEQRRISEKIKKEKYRSKGMCLKCSGKLHIDADAGCVTCINCRERAHR